MDEKIVIFKNEKIGDLIHSYKAIQKIISKNQYKEIIIFLSNYNFEMNFLFESENVKFKKISEKINLKDKIKIILYFIKHQIKETYIFKPSSFLFLLPLILYFKNIKFYGICVNNKSYRRPSSFFRNFLFKYVINDRGSKNIRKSINDLHIELVSNTIVKNSFASYKKNLIKKIDTKKYLLIHYNKFKFNKLEWTIEDLFLLIKNLEKYFDKIVLTNDINDNKTNELLQKKFLNNHKIKYHPNIKGKYFFDLIGNAKLVIALHGMITAIAALQNTKVIDLFNCDLKTINDFYKYKNAFHEFKPKLNSYEFLIPRKNCLITLNRIKNLIENGRKTSS